MIKKWIWDKTTECHILLLGDSTHRCFFTIKKCHPPIWREHKYWNSCLTGLSKWSAVSYCINSSGIKSRECVVSVISITSVFWILHSMMTHTIQDEDEGADFERKASNLDAKRKDDVNKSYSKNKGHGEIKSLETTSDTSNQQLPNRLRKQQ